MLTSSIHAMCENLVAVKRHRWWEQQYAEFEDYVFQHYGYSKTRTKLYLRFGKFCAMCRDERLPMPNSPELVQKVMKMTQGKWMPAWRIIVDMAEGPITADHIKATLEHHGFITDKRLPQNVLDRMASKRAGKALSSIQDPDAITHPGKEWQDRETVLAAVSLSENAQ